jgi:glycosyltransferase involved in cell wall biosynthesis
MQHLQQIDTDHRYTVLVEPGDTWQPANPAWSTVECPYKRFSFNPLQLITLGLFIERLKPDLVHFSMTPQEPVWYLGPRVTTTHDLTMLRFARPGKLPTWLHAVRMGGYRFLFWYSHKVAKHIIVPSQYVAGDLSKLHAFAAPKITVTLEASEPPLSIKAKPAPGVRRPFIMHVGSPFPHKNIERLVEAFIVLKETQPKLQLVLIGKKEQYFERLEQTIASHPHRKDIVIPGFVPDESLKWLYQNAEAYVLPALSEGFGLPGLEAMTYGCPLVSSNATCSPEIYGNAAHFFDPNSVDDIAQKTLQVLTNKRLRQVLIKKGYARLKHFSWERMARQTLEIYSNALTPKMTTQEQFNAILQSSKPKKTNAVRKIRRLRNEQRK